MDKSSQLEPEPSADVSIGAQGTDPRAQGNLIEPSTIAIGCALLAVVAVLLFHVSPWITAGLGDSHDGYNAAVWGLGARGAVEDPIGNRLGGVHPDGFHYASHPPLLVWSLTPVVALADDWPLGLRLVPLGASIAAVGLLVVLILQAGISKWATAAGVLLAGTSGMYLTYGALVDTPVFSLPFALAAIWAAQRTWQSRPPPVWLALVVGSLAALAGWQALFAAAIAGALAVVASIRSSSQSQPAAFGLLCGAGIGLLVDLSWTWWVLGRLSPLLDQGISRSELPASMWFDHQAEFALDLFGAPLLIISGLGILAALLITVTAWARKARTPGTTAEQRPRMVSVWNTSAPLLAVLAIAVAVYAAIFKNGAWVHSYWNYYGVALAGVACASLVDAVVRWTGSFSPAARRTVIGALAAVTVVIAASGAGTRSLADDQIQAGLDVVPLVESLPRAADPHQIVVNTVGGDPVKPWLRWTTHGQNGDVALADVADLPRGDEVLITLPFTVDPSAWNDTSALVSGKFALLRAGDLAEMSGG